MAVFLPALPSSPVCIIQPMICNTGTDKAPVDPTVQAGWGQKGQWGFPKVQILESVVGFFRPDFILLTEDSTLEPVLQYLGVNFANSYVVLQTSSMLQHHIHISFTYR